VIRLDRYVLGARLAPAVLVLLPVTVTAGSWLQLDLFSAKGAAASFVWLAVSAALAQLGRDAGKKKEAVLFEKWDGRPSTQLLRSSNRELNTATRERYRAAAGRLMPGLKVPTQEEESVDPAAADVVFDAVGDVLKEKTRDRERFYVLFSENVSYGFRRNMWGMKAYGVALAVLGCGACAAFALSHPSKGSIVATAVNGILVIYWAKVVNADWVRVVAFEYARRLLASLDDLAPVEKE
jgi:hypothetical protein